MGNDAIEQPSQDQPIDSANLSAPEQVAASESSPDSGENHEDKTTNVHKRIGALTAKNYAEQRRADAAEAKVRELEAQKEQPVKPSEEAPVIPTDLYDEEAMRKYHTDTQAHNLKVATNAANNVYESQQVARQQTEAQKQHQAVISTYAENAIKDGVDLDKLRVAEQVLVDSGIDPVVGKYLMQDINGAKIAEYLHDNPAVLREVNSLDPISAGIKIAGEIKAQALSTTPKVSGASEPTPEFIGGGSSTKDTFENRNPGTTFI